jgi:hypothetical protein
MMVDMQLEPAPRASLPSPRFPGEQGWYFNQGEKAGVTDDWFSVAALGERRALTARSRSAATDVTRGRC